MKASKKISVDFFIKRCVQNIGLTTERDIVDKAREEGEDYHLVKELIREGNSKAYNEIKYEEDFCNECGNSTMYDSEMREYYCPVCD